MQHVHVWLLQQQPVELSELCLTMCRVTPEGGKAVEATSCTAAWSALFQGDAQSGRHINKSGVHMFGLQHPRVCALLHQLPNAARCERYLGWDGDKPDIPVLVSDTSVRALPLAQVPDTDVIILVCGGLGQHLWLPALWRRVLFISCR